MAPRSLTDMAARDAKGKEKPYKLAAGAGLYLQVMPKGWWCMKLPIHSTMVDQAVAAAFLPELRM